MSTNAIPSVSAPSLAGGMAAAMLERLADGANIEEVVAAALQHGVPALGYAAGAVVSQQGRLWNVLRSHGALGTLPEERIAEAVDRGDLVADRWRVVIPLAIQNAPPHVLVLAVDDDRQSTIGPQSSGAEGGLAPSKPVRAPASSAGPTALRAAAEVLAHGIGIARDVRGESRRARRLEEMLRIAAQWSSKEDCDELLETIAEAAARLLNAERASIFLWDRARGVLVGRPALGVEGNVLEVEDRSGVVGAVLQSGQPRRWHAGDDVESEVNRSVDRRLRFETRSLMAVPLWDPNSNAGKRDPIGVFELINRRHGTFTQEDVAALEELATQADAAIQNTQGRQRLVDSRNRLVDSAAETARVVGSHPLITAVRETAARVADTELSVLILGENGTGKEVLARSIHFQSRRRTQPFVAVNCAALVESLLESELFGHEKGAFTDAHQTRPGKFELASGGTLFLDEVGDLSAGGQAKLLRVLEEKKIVRVGGSQPIPVDVRVLAATNQPLAEMVRNKRFREDLFFRLNIVTLTLPPLRDRGEDIVTLAEHFLEQFANQVGRRTPRLTATARRALRDHRWPGNIRELRNLIERITYLCSGDSISETDLGLNQFGGNGSASGLASVNVATEEADDAESSQALAEATMRFQIRHIERAIESTRGNMTEAARVLGLHRSNLYRKMRQLGMETSGE